MAAFQQGPSSSSGGPSFGGSAGSAGSKKLTWSERQAQAKKQQEEEEAASRAAIERSIPAAKAVSPAVTGNRSVPPPPAAPSAPAPPPLNMASRPFAASGGSDATPALPAPPGAATGAAEAARAAEEEKAAADEEFERQADNLAKLNLAEEEANEAAAILRPAGQSAVSGGLRAKVLFDYEAEEDNELSLREGETVEDVEQIDEGWWSGTVGGRSGLYPGEPSLTLAISATSMEALTGSSLTHS